MYKKFKYKLLADGSEVASYFSQSYFNLFLEMYAKVQTTDKLKLINRSDTPNNALFLILFTDSHILRKFMFINIDISTHITKFNNFKTY